MRRLILIAGLWLGLLGVMQPLLACAMNPSLLSCCPAGDEMPCDQGSDQPGMSHQPTDCCATAPATTSTVIAVDSRQADLAQLTGDLFPGNGIAVAVSEVSLAPKKFRLTSSIPIHPPDYRGTETYLRTGRLRL